MKPLFLCIILLFSFISEAKQADISILVDTLSQKLPADEPGCSIGVFEKGNVLLGKGFGLANAELNVPMSNNNVHRMASVSKQFVAMAVYLLADEGKIDLSNDIRNYVNDLPDYGHHVSINAMIGHVAGMG